MSASVHVCRPITGCQICRRFGSCVVLLGSMLADTAFSTVGAVGGASSLLSVVQGQKLFAVQSAGSNSILRCSELGELHFLFLYLHCQAGLHRCYPFPSSPRILAQESKALNYDCVLKNRA